MPKQRRRDERAGLSSFKPLARNPNKHTPKGLGMLDAAMSRHGFVAPMTASADGTVLDGNARLETVATAFPDVEPIIIRHDGTRPVIAIRTDIPDADDPRARDIIVTANRIAEVDLAYDVGVLREFSAEGLDLKPYEFDAKTLTEIVGVQTGRTDPDAVPEPRRTSITRGDLFALGEHRLLCGDSTSAEDVARVMGGEKADATITDPPYAVNYDRSQKERGGNASVHAPYHEGDTPTEVLGFMAHIPSDVLVMTFPVDRHMFALTDALRQNGMTVRKECVWVKDQFSFWPGAQYQQKHEPILICGRAGKPINSDVPANQSTVFEFPKPKAHGLHPTARPVELFSAIVRFHAPSVVYEPFSGSGTTLIACEQLGRKCRAIEIEPSYVQVAIDRWEAFTGRKAEKL